MSAARPRAPYANGHRSRLASFIPTMPTDLPYAADAQVSLSYDELEACLSGILSDIANLRPLQVLRLQYQKELAQSHVTVQTKFNYAWGLVKSPLHEHQVEGVQLLQGMSFVCRQHAISDVLFTTDIYRTEPTRRRECLYYLALGYYKMGKYADAKNFNGRCNWL